MGHYDDCYAADDFHSMSLKEKEVYIRRFQKELEDSGNVSATYDDVSGWILSEWVRSYPELIVIKGHHTLEVRTKANDEHQKEESRKSLEAFKKEREKFESSLTIEKSLKIIEDELQEAMALSFETEKALEYLKNHMSPSH